jgi:hypothetical protein
VIRSFSLLMPTRAPDDDRTRFGAGVRSWSATVVALVKRRGANTLIEQRLDPCTARVDDFKDRRTRRQQADHETPPAHRI